MALELFQQTFLGASITNFSVNVGLNSNSSSLNVSLVRDSENKREGSAVDEGYHAWHEGILEVDANGNLTGNKFHGFPAGGGSDYQSTGDVFYGPVPGSPVYFKYYVYDSQESDNDYDNQNANGKAGLQDKKSNNKKVFEFNGLVKNYQRDQSTSGESFSVSVEDPRLVLEGTKVILAGYSGTTAPSDWSANVVRNPFGRRLKDGYLGYYNVLNPFGYYDGANNFGEARNNQSGIPWYSPNININRYGINHAMGVLPALDAMLSAGSPNYIKANEPFGGPIYYGEDFRENQIVTAKATKPINAHRYLVDVRLLYNLHQANGGIIPSDYRISGQETSLLQIIQGICETAGADFFINMIDPTDLTHPFGSLESTFSGIIQIVPLARDYILQGGAIRNAVDKAQKTDSNGLPAPEGPWANKLVSANVGYEFNDRINGVMMFGAPRTRVVGVTATGALFQRDDFFADTDQDGVVDEWLLENSPSTEMDGATLYGYPIDGSADQAHGVNNDRYVAWNYPGGNNVNKLKNLNNVETSAGRKVSGPLGLPIPVTGEGLIDLFPVWGYTKNPLFKTSGQVQVEAQGWPIIGRFNDDDPYRDWDAHEGHPGIIEYYNAKQTVVEYRCLFKPGIGWRDLYWEEGGKSGDFPYEQKYEPGAGPAAGGGGRTQAGDPGDAIIDEATCEANPEWIWARVITYPCNTSPYADKCQKKYDPNDLDVPLEHIKGVNAAGFDSPGFDTFDPAGKNKDTMQINMVYRTTTPSTTNGVCGGFLDPRGECDGLGGGVNDWDKPTCDAKNGQFKPFSQRNKISCHAALGEWIGNRLPLRPQTATIPIAIPFYDGGPVNQNGNFSKFYYATVTELRAAAVSMDSWLGFVSKYDPYITCYMGWYECPVNAVNVHQRNAGLFGGGMAQPPQNKVIHNPGALAMAFIHGTCTKDTALLDQSEIEHMQKKLIWKEINKVATQFYGRVYAMALPFNELDAYGSEGDGDDLLTEVNEATTLATGMNKWVRIVNEDVAPIGLNGRLGTFEYEHKWDIASAGWPGGEVRFDSDATNTRHPQNVNFFDSAGNLSAFLLYPTNERLKLCGENHTLNFDDISGKMVHHAPGHSLGPIVGGVNYTWGKSYVKAEVDSKTHWLYDISTVDIHMGKSTTAYKPFGIISAPSAVRYNLPDYLNLGLTGQCFCKQGKVSDPEKYDPANGQDYDEYDSPGNKQADGHGHGCECSYPDGSNVFQPVDTGDDDSPTLNSANCEKFGEEAYQYDCKWIEKDATPETTKQTDVDNQQDCEALGVQCHWVPRMKKLCIPHVRVRDAGIDLANGFMNMMTGMFGPQFTNKQINWQAANSLAQDTGRIQLIDAAYKPWTGAIPQQSNRYTWGPWAQGIGFGQAKVDFATDYHPAAFGSEALMNSAAIGRCISNTKPEHQTIETGTVTLEGFPIYGIGEQIIGTGVGPYITDISVDVGTGGLTTSYTMKVERRFGELNQIYERRLRNANKAVLRLADQMRNMQKSVKLPNPKDFDTQ